MQQVDPALSFKELWQELEPWERRLDDEVTRLEPELIRLRRHIHSHPEPSGEEIETSKLVSEELQKCGVDAWIARSDIGNRVGAVADLTVGTPPPDAPLIALRCDLDALRMPDEKKVDYASRIPGVAHACGHDAHTTILLGAAMAMSAIGRQPDALADVAGVRLRLLFQASEETSNGADWLVSQGAMENVDAVLGLHVDPERLVGEVGIRYGALTANCDEIEIEVDGHGGHAARPHHSIDPVAAAAHLVSTLYEFVPRTVDSRSAAVVTIGKIHGGYAPNVIPERVELCGTLRTVDAATRERIKSRVQDICAGVERTSGAKITVRFLQPLKAVMNHPQVTAALEQAAWRVVGRENAAIIEQPSMGGEDFSVYLEHAPGALLRLGCGIKGAAPTFLHSSTFDLDENAIGIGTRIMLRAALVLSSGLRANAKKD